MGDEIQFDEAAHSKAAAQLKAAVAALDALPKLEKGQRLPSIEKLVDKLLADVTAIVKKSKENMAAFDQEVAEAKKESQRNLDMEKFHKEYAKCVKETDGLTTLRPSCIKAFQAFDKVPTVASAKKVVEAMQTHAKEVAKEAKAKGDKESKKAGDDFAKAIEALIAKLHKDVKAITG